MSIFEDKTYNEMDWVSQAVEPIVSSLNDKLKEFPEELEVTFSDLTRLAFNGYSELSINQHEIVNHLLRKHLQKRLDDIDREIYDTYQLVVEGTPTLDMANHTLSGGRIYIKRIIEHFEEKTLLGMMGKHGLGKLYSLDHRKVDVARANEIIELIGGYDGLLKTKSIQQKLNGIHNAIALIMSENKWNLRNVDLSNRIVEWVSLYLENGNLAALTNFCKFKVMTHEGHAIYSVQEEPV